jgi:Domain of unknown function (DUF5916)
LPFPRLLVLSLVIVGSSVMCLAEKTIRAARLTQSDIKVDGFLNEPAWQLADEVTDFTQYDPAEGAEPTEKTSVRILYDDAALYVGVYCYDRHPRGIVYQLSRRDHIVESDRVTVMIDSYDDNQTAFVFAASVSGVQFDGILTNAGQLYDDTWDAIWSVETRRLKDGWSAEFRIPFNALRFSHEENNDYHWGVNFRRYISRKQETDEWVMVSRTVGLKIPYWGSIAGIHGISPPPAFSAIPYVRGRETLESASPAGGATSRADGAAGIDFNYGISKDFSLSATINPDFGQVEVDQAVLNLTVFETLFPEKRPFFVEGSNVFAFGVTSVNAGFPLFFSRRIGRRPSGSDIVSSMPGTTVVENPQTTSILGAAKISGRTSGGLSIGALTATTDREKGVVEYPDGHRSDILTENLGTYNVIRLRQEFEGNSSIGGLVTMTGKEHTLPSVTGGVDWNARIAGGTYAIDGFAAFAHSSTTSGEPNGAAGRLVLDRLSAEHFYETTVYEFFTRSFDINDIGFFAQPRDHGGYSQLSYYENSGPGFVRRYRINLTPEYRWNWDKVLTRFDLQVQLSAEYTSLWVTEFTYTSGFPSSMDASQGIIGTYRRPQSHDFRLTISSSTRSVLSGSMEAGVGFDEKEKTDAFASLSLTYHPTAWLELGPTLYYQRTRKELTGVLSGGGIVSLPYGGRTFSLFGNRSVDEFDTALRGALAFTRSLSLQFFAQVLLARGRYDAYALLAGSTTLVPLATPSMNYDFNLATVNANLLLRWEYLPGSTVFLVWTHSRSGDSMQYATGFLDRFREAFSLPHEDVLLLKVNYVLSL